eukprot:TRINITY_DN4769_c0_g1_i10.p1 TRINITY_DN4769_c0_g1~~TRINITY_DN4769_c0_g1_i10.p1  ORF type:complete len:1054 (-),score=254.63 TRINITY_DN4769_c0_g1_i10:147-3131(-)
MTLQFTMANGEVVEDGTSDFEGRMRKGVLTVKHKSQSRTFTGQVQGPVWEGTWTKGRKSGTFRFTCETQLEEEQRLGTDIFLERHAHNLIWKQGDRSMLKCQGCYHYMRRSTLRLQCSVCENWNYCESCTLSSNIKINAHPHPLKLTRGFQGSVFVCGNCFQKTNNPDIWHWNCSSCEYRLCLSCSEARYITCLTMEEQEERRRVAEKERQQEIESKRLATVVRIVRAAEKDKDKEIRAWFDRYDEDKSGNIDISEISNALLEVWPIQLSQSYVMEIMYCFTNDKKGTTMNFSAFRKFTLWAIDLRDKYNLADRDNSGLVARKEIAGLMALDVFKLGDVDNSGTLTFEEYVNLMIVHQDLNEKGIKPEIVTPTGFHRVINRLNLLGSVSHIEIYFRRYPPPPYSALNSWKQLLPVLLDYKSKFPEIDKEWLEEQKKEEAEKITRAKSAARALIQKKKAQEELFEAEVAKKLEEKKAEMARQLEIKKAEIARQIEEQKAEIEKRKAELARNSESEAKIKLEQHEQELELRKKQEMQLKMQEQFEGCAKNNKFLRNLKRKEATEIAQGIISSLSSGQLWEDTSFTLELCRQSLQDHTALFKRPKEIVPSAILYDTGVSPLDVVQGGLGNCWFVQAIATVAQLDPGLIEDMIIPYSEYGFYQVLWWKDDSFTVVTIDDRLLVGPYNNLLCARGKSQNEFWVPILEKSYAKLHGGYDRITGGLATEALVDFTGGVGRFWHNKNDWWEVIEAGTKDNCMMALSTPAAPGGDSVLVHGLPQQHAFGLLKGVTVTVPRVNLVYIRNPHSCNEWDGPWSDSSAEWTPQLNKQLDHKDDKNDGCFFMEISDVKKYFQRLCAVHRLENYEHNLFSSICTPDHFLQDNMIQKSDMWTFKSNQTGSVVICLRKQDKRRIASPIDPDLLMGLGVCKKPSQNEKDRTLTKFYNLPCLTNERDVYYQLEAVADQLYTVVAIFSSKRDTFVTYYFSIFHLPGSCISFEKI